MSIYRSLALVPPEQRDALLGDFDLRDGATVHVDTALVSTGMPPTPMPLMRSCGSTRSWCRRRSGSGRAR